jgi:hypothetical protein
MASVAKLRYTGGSKMAPSRFMVNDSLRQWFLCGNGFPDVKIFEVLRAAKD